MSAPVDTVYVVESPSGALVGPFAQAPGLSGCCQTLHETAGHVHAFDRDRDWFECPWCHDEVTGEDLARADGCHDCDESTLDR